jgi:hypothetical protein
MTQMTEMQGLEVKRQRTLEVTPKPSMDWVMQPLHLRNRRGYEVCVRSREHSGSNCRMDGDGYTFGPVGLC